MKEREMEKVTFEDYKKRFPSAKLPAHWDEDGIFCTSAPIESEPLGKVWDDSVKLIGVHSDRGKISYYYTKIKKTEVPNGGKTEGTEK